MVFKCLYKTTGHLKTIITSKTMEFIPYIEVKYKTTIPKRMIECKQIYTAWEFSQYILRGTCMKLDWYKLRDILSTSTTTGSRGRIRYKQRSNKLL